MSFRFRKKNIIVRRTLAKIVEKVKVTKLTYFIAPLLHSSNPLKQKDISQKLVFTVAVLLKGNRSSFSKQLGINCTCEQIGLFLISTRGCGSHSWKLLKSPICSLTYFIAPLLHSSNPLKQKDISQKLVFTVAVLLKGNRSSFSKQLGINCTCEQIGLFLISTRGCGSHSWKLLKSPICSRVQLIPNCFSNRPISYTNHTSDNKI